ncbi:MAG TPA: lytic murein transglycosylase [Sphingomicrobium sp.]|nr:lytic murein transglycosylase [Sphingomicrobium sp.]
MRWTGSWIAIGLASLALGPAVAQVDPLAPLPQTPQPRPAQPQPQPRPAAPATVPVPVQTASLQAQPYAATSGFEAYKQYLMHAARQQGIREATIQGYIPALRLNERAMQLDRAQRPGAAAASGYVPPLSPYLRDHVTASLISRGQSRYSAHWPSLNQIYARFGVDPAVLMAIYGKETSYGTVTGSFDLLESLASLAYEGRRRDLFQGEFLAALKLIDSGVPRARLRGSYAGATGYPQFMPSVVLRLRADGDGDGYADIWSNEVDALASIANYLRDAGWKPGVPWGARARVPANLNREAIRSRMNSPICPAVFRRHSRWMTIAEWRSLGVVPTRAIPDSEMATLMEPDGPGVSGYLLTGNYRAILDYNCSNFYAMSVVTLADAIARR